MVGGTVKDKGQTASIGYREYGISRSYEYPSDSIRGKNHPYRSERRFGVVMNGCFT